MKSKSLIIWIAGLIGAALVTVQSCKKDGESLSKTDLAIVEHENYADALYDEVDNLSGSVITGLDDGGYQTGTAKSTEDGLCYTVTVDHPDLTTFPKIVTLDFGTGCSVVFNGDTITRTGKIIISLSNRWYIEGATQTMTFENFTMNGIKVEGSRTLTNLGLNSKNHPEIGVVLQNGKITFNDTLSITRSSDQVRELILHLNPLKDSVVVTGSAEGTNIMGDNYTRTITMPLVFTRCVEYAYRWAVVAGTIQVTNSRYGVFTIEHTGTGCTDQITVTKNGNHYTYTFKYRYRHNTQG